MNFDIDYMKKEVAKLMLYFGMDVCPMQAKKPVKLLQGTIEEIAHSLSLEVEQCLWFLAAYVPREDLEGIYLRTDMPSNKIGGVSKITPPMEALYHELTHFLQGQEKCLDASMTVDPNDPYRLNTDIEKEAYMISAMFASGLDAETIILRIDAEIIPNEIKPMDWLDVVWEAQVKPSIIEINNRA